MDEYEGALLVNVVDVDRAVLTHFLMACLYSH